MNIWNIIYRFSWGILALLTAIGLFLVFVPKARKLALLQEIKTGIEARNTERETRIRELRTRQERFVQDPEYVEHTARETGMVLPDEIVYTFTNQHFDVSRPGGVGALPRE